MFCQDDNNFRHKLLGLDLGAWKVLLDPYSKYLKSFVVLMSKFSINIEDQADCLNDFFVYLLEKNILKKYAPERCRLLTFLYGYFKYFLFNWIKKSRNDNIHDIEDFQISETIIPDNQKENNFSDEKKLELIQYLENLLIQNKEPVERAVYEYIFDNNYGFSINKCFEKYKHSIDGITPEKVKYAREKMKKKLK